MSATGRKVISGCTSAVSEVFMRPSLVSCCQEPQSKLTDPVINYRPVPHLESCFHKVKLQQNQAALGLKNEMHFPLASQYLPDKVLRGQIKPAREVYCQTKTQLLPTPEPSLSPAPVLLSCVPADCQSQFICAALDFVLRLKVRHVVCVHSINGYDLVSYTQVGYRSFAAWSHLRENKKSEWTFQGGDFNSNL